MTWIRNWLIIAAVASIGISIFWEPKLNTESPSNTKSDRFFGRVGVFVFVFSLIGILLGLIVYFISNFLPTWVGVTFLIIVGIVFLLSVLPKSKAEALFEKIFLTVIVVLLLLVIALPIIFTLKNILGLFGSVPDIRNLFKCDGACVSVSGESDSVPPFYFLIPMFMMLGFIIMGREK